MPGELVTTTACTKEQSCQLQGRFSLWCARCLLGLASKPGGEALAEAAVVSRGVVSNKLDQRLPRGCLSRVWEAVTTSHTALISSLPYRPAQWDPLLPRWLSLAHFLLSWVPGSQLSQAVRALGAETALPDGRSRRATSELSPLCTTGLFALHVTLFRVRFRESKFSH